jgi:hypothetical protein
MTRRLELAFMFQAVVGQLWLTGSVRVFEVIRETGRVFVTLYESSNLILICVTTLAQNDRW